MLVTFTLICLQWTLALGFLGLSRSVRMDGLLRRWPFVLAWGLACLAGSWGLICARIQGPGLDEARVCYDWALALWGLSMLGMGGGLWLRSGRPAILVLLALTVQVCLAAFMLSAHLSAQYILAQTSPPIPFLGISFSMLINLATSGLLLATGMHALWACYPGRTASRGRAAAAFRVAQQRLVSALFVRMLAVAVTLAVGLRYEPFEARLLIQTMLTLGVGLLFIRLLLGFFLPMIYLVQVYVWIRQRKLEAAWGQLLPMTVMICLGEAIAAALTAGTLGLAF